MKKTLKLFIGLILVIGILSSVICINAFAAGTVISFSKSSLSVGDTLTVTVTVNPGEAMYAVSCIVNYDSNVLEYKSGGAEGGAGTVKIVESPSGDKRVSYSLTFTAKSAGSSVVSVSDCMYSTMGTNGAVEKGVSGASASVSVTNAALSGNANLSALSLSAGSLSPAFSAGRTSYTVNVKNSVTELKVYATAADSGAKVVVSGDSTLKLGSNIRTVTVTAPNGTTKTYTITINRSETDEEVTSSEEEPTDSQPLSTSIDGVNFTVAADISSVTLFKGFTVSQAEYNSVQVSVAKDSTENYTIYYLKSADNDRLVPYTYNTDENTFKKLEYITQGEYTYIFADIPEDRTVPENYYTTNAKISGFDVKCFADSNSDMTDFYYVYCFSDGRYGFYRFDSRENVMQRFPELELVDMEDTVDTIEAQGSIADRFKTLTVNAKVVVLGLILVVIGAVALAVLFVIKLVNRKKDIDCGDGFISENDFDNISINNFSLMTEESVNNNIGGTEEETITQSVDDTEKE